MADDCLFCKIVAGQVPSERVYEDDDLVAFKDIRPAAPQHILLVPRKHVASVNELGPADAGLMGRLVLAAGALAGRLGIDQSGYRLVVNNNRDAGQEVFHLHLHLMGGRKLGAMG